MNKRIKNILRCYAAGIGIKETASTFHISRNTVRKYVRLFLSSGKSIEQLLSLPNGQLDELFGCTDTRHREPSSKRIELEALLPGYVSRLSRKGMSVRKLFKEYHTEYPDGYQLSSFKRIVSEYRFHIKVVGHVEHYAAEQMYIDFAGDRLEVVDEMTGETKKAEVFVAILPFSHYTYCEAVWSQRKEDLIKACENAIQCDEDNQYRYGFEADNSSVHSEWLYQKANKKRAKEVELFYREKDSFDIHTKFAVGKELAGKRMVRANALLLSVAAQFNDPTAVEIMKWLNDTTIISGSNDEKIWNTATIQLDDIRMKQRIVEFSRYADLGIENIEKIDNTIVSMHTQYDDEGNEVKAVTFPFRKNESEGTIKYFSLAYPIIDALDNGKRLIIDEFDSKMHPLLTCRIITLFNSKETNPKNAQLIFTTHDTNLLSANIFRRDQIWFTQKDRYGATELYSLAEYKVRNDASFEKDYLSGKYGAIPIVGDLTRLFNTQEK